MLNRRYIRVKVMQGLYAFFQSETSDMEKSEQHLNHSIHKIYDLYIFLLLLLTEVRDFAENTLNEAKNKRLPTAEDLNPSLKFINNPILVLLSKNLQLKKEANARKIAWQEEPELIKKLYNAIKQSESYVAYMKSDDNSFKTQQNFIIDIYVDIIGEFESVRYFFEEKNIHWADDVDYVNSMVVKTIEAFTEQSDEKTALLPLYKDPEEDRKFVSDLFRKTIINDKENSDYVAEKTKNWEVDRIAVMDILLMKMAITELLHFSSVPIKVTLNEYIELSKDYSTPKSKIFINGILDKLVADFKRTEKIKKTGRGLME